MMGGCGGTTAILELQVVPTQDCLTIEVNNCNGGVLEVTNRCTETLILGGVEIGADGHHVSLDVLEKQEDSYLLIENYSNFSNYLPAQDEAITVLGSLGDRPIQVTFVKTAALC